MKEMTYIYAISKDKKKIIDSVSNLGALQKRLQKKAFPEDTIFIKVDVGMRLAHLETDEQIGEDILNKAFLAGIVAGVSFEDVLKRLEEAGIAEEVKLMAPAVPKA